MPRHKAFKMHETRPQSLVSIFVQTFHWSLCFARRVHWSIFRPVYWSVFKEMLIDPYNVLDFFIGQFFYLFIGQFFCLDAFIGQFLYLDFSLVTFCNQTCSMFIVHSFQPGLFIVQFPRIDVFIGLFIIYICEGYYNLEIYKKCVFP